MRLLIGWGSLDISFVPRTETISQHVRWVWTEGQRGDGGITYEWASEPASLPQMIAKLTEVNGEFEAWKADFLASLPPLEEEPEGQ